MSHVRDDVALPHVRSSLDTAYAFRWVRPGSRSWLAQSSWLRFGGAVFFLCLVVDPPLAGQPIASIQPALLGEVHRLDIGRTPSF